MRQIINYSAVAISAMFIAVGCGGSGGGDGGSGNGDGGSGNGDGNSSTSQAEPTAPAATEFISLKVAGMT
jgi:hypothetical protein